jgi:sirohydrochlorin cobaltochelatase
VSLGSEKGAHEMKKIKILHHIIFLVMVIGIVVMPASIMAHGVDLRSYSDDDRPDKVGLLVIALLPRDVATAAKQDLMNKRIKEAFPGMAVRWSFFNIGAEQADAFATTDERMSPKQRLDQMEEEGITHVAILPLSVIPGETYNRLVWMVDTLRNVPTKFRKISLAKPFFGAPGDIRRTCQTVLSILPGHTEAGEAVVLFFEEHSRLGDYIYPGIQYYFWQLDEAVFIGTAGTTPGMQDVFHSLQNSSSENVYLVPFLPYQTPTLAAWKIALENSGYHVKQIKEPVIGHGEALDVMISRLKAAIDELGLPQEAALSEN